MDKVVVAVLKADATELGENWANVDAQSSDLSLVEGKASWDNTKYADLAIDFTGLTAPSNFNDTKWAREKYANDAWQSMSGQMRVREVGGVKVVNMCAGKGMTYRFTYSEDGASLGVANYITFGLSNHWSNATAMSVKVSLIKKDGSFLYLLGDKDNWFEMPVTESLLYFDLSFDDTEVYGIRITNKSNNGADTYFYMSSIYLKHLAEPYADVQKPQLLLSKAVKDAAKDGITAPAGTNLLSNLQALLAGIKAYDNVDKVIAVGEDNVDFGNLNPANPAAGVYKVTVSVKDAANNEAKAELNVYITQEYEFTLPEAIEGRTIIVHLWKDGQDGSLDLAGTVDGTKLTIQALPGYDKAVVAVLKAEQTELGENWANVDYQSGDLAIAAEGATAVTGFPS